MTIIMPPQSLTTDLQADILDGLATYLAALVSFPVYYPELPRSVNVDVSTNTLPQCAVLSDGGDAPSAGSNSYVKIARVRADIRCYGRTMLEAKATYRRLATLLKELRPVTVIVGPAGGETRVFLHNAIHSAGPIPLIDPETSWPFVVATWGISGSEVEIP